MKDDRKDAKKSCLVLISNTGPIDTIHGGWAIKRYHSESIQGYNEGLYHDAIVPRLQSPCIGADLIHIFSTQVVLG